MSDSYPTSAVFFDVQRGLPRQGPGLDDCTIQALSLCSELPEAPRILDVGCGPGMQTLALARALPGASITALDLTREYLLQCDEAVRSAGLEARVRTLEADMTAMTFSSGSFDLIWSEGAAYSMGFDEALRDWRHLLVDGGCLAVSELVWLVPDPPAEVAAFFGEEYPAMALAQDVASRFEGFGYELLGRFTLPDAAWWSHYYEPLEAKMPELLERYAQDPVGLRIVAGTAAEIEMRRRFGSSFGYEFFVARRRD